MKYDPKTLFGEGTTSTPADVEPVKVELRKDEFEVEFCLFVRPQSTIKARKLMDAISNAENLTDPDTCIDALRNACEKLVKPNKRKDGTPEPAVITDFEGLTLANLEFYLSDGFNYAGPIFDEMREDRTKTWAYKPELMVHLMVHSPAVRAAVGMRLFELVDRIIKKDEDRKNDSGSSSA